MAGTRPRGTGARAAGGRGAAPACAAAEGPADPGARPARGAPARGGGLWEGQARAARALCFLGLGVYRAWIEMAFVGTPIDYPTQHFAGHNAFDLAMICSLFALAALSRRVAPLHERRLACPGEPRPAPAGHGGRVPLDGRPAAGALARVALRDHGGAGIAVMILLWSELYACLSPVRICLYYATSLLAGAAIVYVYRGSWRPGSRHGLPAAGRLAAVLRECYRRISDERRPAARPGLVHLPVEAHRGRGDLRLRLRPAGGRLLRGLGPALLAGDGRVRAGGRRGHRAAAALRGVRHIYATWLPFLSATFLILPALASSGASSPAPARTWDTPRARSTS